MDIITENRLLKENYVLRQENDRLKEELKDLHTRASGRSIAIARIMGQAAIIIARWKYQELHTDLRSDYYRGESSALHWVFDCMKSIAETDTDMAEIIKEPLRTYQEYSEYSRRLHAEANERHFEKMRKRAAARKKERNNDSAT